MTPEVLNHGNPEVAVAEINHKTARNRNHCGYDTNIRLSHIIDVIVSVRNNSGTKRTYKTTCKSTNCRPEREFLLFTSIDLEILSVEKGHSYTLLGSEAGGEEDPEGAVINKNLLNSLKVVSKPFIIPVHLLLLYIQSSSRSRVLRELICTVRLRS